MTQSDPTSTSNPGKDAFHASFVARYALVIVAAFVVYFQWRISLSSEGIAGFTARVISAYQSGETPCTSCGRAAVHVDYVWSGSGMGPSSWGWKENLCRKHASDTIRQSDFLRFMSIPFHLVLGWLTAVLVPLVAVWSIVLLVRRISDRTENAERTISGFAGVFVSMLIYLVVWVLLFGLDGI